MMPNQEEKPKLQKILKNKIIGLLFSFVKIIQYCFFVLKMMTVVQIKNYGSPFQVFTLPSLFQIKDYAHGMKCSLFTCHTKFDKI